MADIEKVPAAPDDATAAEEPTELPLADVDDVAGGSAGIPPDFYLVVS
jgi:hypothetical protein